MALLPLKRQRASDEVYEALRESILARLFKPGERLQMTHIAEKLGVSMTPLRQAIQRLAAEGLIEIRPRSGTFITRLDAREVDETCEIRCALECLAGEKAIERIAEDELEEFRSILRKLEKPVVSAESRKRHEQANTRFHNHLIACSGNQRLVEMYNGLNAHLQIARLHAGDLYWADRLKAEQREHERIVTALEARNPAELRQALREHILRAKQSLLAALREEGDARAERALGM
ncbi:MAG TPA: GntR family transcriptional regulator [Bryobacteraceae bacterium]|nr:GntR family transcriptional regulator [Bryobacteraceae bacterium]